MAATQASAPVPAHGIDLINEDDSRGALFALDEQVAAAPGVTAPPKLVLDEIGAAGC